MPLSWCSHRAWKDFWYFIQKDLMCTAASRVIYSLGQLEGNLCESSKEPRAWLCLRPHLTLLPGFFDDTTFCSDSLAVGGSVLIPGGYGPRGSLRLIDLFVHACSCTHIHSEFMCHPSIFIQLLFQWLWEVSVEKQSYLLLLCKLSDLQWQSLLSQSTCVHV